MVAFPLAAFAAALLALVPLRLAEADFDGPVNAQVVRVIDIHVRIAGIDAPELRARCDDERAKAEAARDFLARRIEGRAVRLTSLRYDKYGGRVDAAVSDARGDVAAAMLKARLARPYYGERREGWCGQA
jgi:micrococcal nuclease